MALITLNLSKGIEARSNPLENPSVSLGNLGAIWSWISGTEPTASGELIDETVALQIISVYSCVRLIAETASSLPLKLFRRMSKGREVAIDNKLYDILTMEPNPEMAAVPFWEAVVGNLALYGNSYCYVQRVAGQIVALWPLHPKKTHPVRLPNGQLAYETRDGLENDAAKIYPKEQILHFKLFSGDGLLGLSPIMLARQGLGLTRAAEKMGARIFANSGRPAGVITQEGTGTVDQKMLLNLRESWQAAQSGDNALKTAFLPGSWKYTPISLSMEDIEFLKTRAFQRAEIAALFHVPPHMIGDTTRQSNTNSEHEALSLVTFTLRPYLYRIENEIKRVLLREDDDLFVEFDIRQLLRGDFKTTQDALAVGRQWGWYSANQVLEEMGDNPIGPVGDIYIVPNNFMNAESLLVAPAPNPAPNTPKPSEGQGDASEVPGKPQGDAEAQRSIVQKCSPMLLVFKDAIGRLQKREKRDQDTVKHIMEPVLNSLVALAVQDACQRLSQEWRSTSEEPRIVSEALKGIEKRSEKWSDGVDVASEEFRKALRTIVSGVYKEFGAQAAQEENSHE